MSTETMFDAINDWRIERLGKFTSSEVHKLLQSGKKKEEYFGKGAMTYIYEKIAEIITGEAPPEINTNTILHGHANELDAVLTYEKLKGVKVDYYGSGNPKYFSYNEVSGGSPDGLVGNDTVLEVKCPYNSANHIKFLMTLDADQLKAESFDYYCQVQMNMLCTGREYADFISYDPRVIDHQLRLFVLNVPRDEALIKEIQERIDKATTIIKEILNGL